MKREKRIEANFTDGYAFAHLCGLQETLLSEEGCPWDREQTFSTLRKYLLEEAEEVASAIDRLTRLEPELRSLAGENSGRCGSGTASAPRPATEESGLGSVEAPPPLHGVNIDSTSLYGHPRMEEWRSAIDDLKEEIGDLLIQPIFQCKLAEKLGYFTLREVIDRTYSKLVRRHPHVFGESKVKSPAEVLDQWSRVKEEETRLKANVINHPKEGEE